MKANRQPITLDLVPIEEETLEASEFLKLVRENPGLIKASNVVHPHPGDSGFGKFLVKYSRPIHKLPTWRAA